PGPVAYRLYAEADVVLGIGTRMQAPEMMWGVDDEIALIQITADPAEAGRRGKATVAIAAMAEHAVPALLRALERRLAKRPDRTEELAGMKAELDREIAHLPQVAHLKVLREEMEEDDVFLDDLTQVAFAARFAFPV